MKKILILMSTYNGEKFLSEQLDSILHQKDVNINLLIRDDGSIDTTPDILEDYKLRFSNNIDIIKGNNIGCLNSFFKLIMLANELHKKYDYYAFADQDDVWLPEKMNIAATLLDNICSDIKLYYCKPQYVDQYLSLIKTKTIKARGSLGEAFIVAPALGCTMVFNYNMLHELSKACVKNIPCLHDILAYRLALALGGTVIYDNSPHILYRQHSSNVVGGVQSIKKRWKRRIGWFIDGGKRKSTVAKDILYYFNNKMPEKCINILKLISYYPDSIFYKYKVLFSKEFRSNSLSHNFMFIIAILFNKI